VADGSNQDRPLASRLAFALAGTLILGLAAFLVGARLFPQDPEAGVSYTRVGFAAAGAVLGAVAGWGVGWLLERPKAPDSLPSNPS
jgi:hypothetical protein